MRQAALIAILLGGTFVTSQAMAGMEVFVYPSKGQTKDQQEQDEFACYKWGKEQTGFDPNQTVQQAAPPPPHGQVVGGAARGAALGAIGGNAAKGAAIGAAVGGGAGAMRRGRQSRRYEAEQQQNQQQYNASLDGYKRAFSACMVGRGYTVS